MFVIPLVCDALYKRKMKGESEKVQLSMDAVFPGSSWEDSLYLNIQFSSLFWAKVHTQCQNFILVIE